VNAAQHSLQWLSLPQGERCAGSIPRNIFLTGLIVIGIFAGGSTQAQEPAAQASVTGEENWNYTIRSWQWHQRRSAAL